MKCKNKIGIALTAFAVLYVMLSGCSPTISSTATSQAICDAWEDTLFRPSRRDTQVTAEGLDRQYKVFGRVSEEAECAQSMSLTMR